MAFNFAQARYNARKAVHGLLSVTASYIDDTRTEAVDISARWTQKQVLTGDLENDGYAQSYEASDRVILSATEAETIGVKRGGTITFPAPYSITLTLHEPLDSDGPFKQVWLVSR